MFSITLARAQHPPSPHLTSPIPALEGVYAHLMDKVATAAIVGQGWAPRQYLTAVVMLLQSPHNAVIKADLRAALGDGGDAALLAMVKKGLLGLRAPSGASCVGVLLVALLCTCGRAVRCCLALVGFLSFPQYMHTWLLIEFEALNTRPQTCRQTGRATSRRRHTAISGARLSRPPRLRTCTACGASSASAARAQRRCCGPCGWVAS